MQIGGNLDTIDIHDSVMERSYNSVILILGFVAGIIGTVIIVSSGIKFIAIVDLTFWLICMFLFIFRNRVYYRTKILVVILFLLIINGISFYEGGFTGIANILIETLVLLAAAFHSIRLAWAVGGSSALFMLFITFAYDKGFHYIDPALLERVKEPFYWYVQTSTTLVFVVVAIFSIKAMRSILQSRVDSLNKALMVLDGHKEELEQVIYYDTLTQLPTRELFYNEVSDLEVKSGILILLNIRGFNTFNSLFGSEYGDGILKSVGTVLKRFNSDKVKICRLGADDFFVWGSGWNNEDAHSFFLSFKVNVNNFLKSSGFKHKLNWYAGACSCFQQIDLDLCHRHAGLAATESKKHQIKGLNFFKPEMEKVFSREKEIDYNLEKAMAQDEFTVLFQGKYDPVRSKLVGMEALTRWNSPELGFVSPVEFIPIVHTSSHFESFSRYIFLKTVHAFVSHIDTLPSHVTLSVNISPRFFLEEGFVNFVLESAEESGIPEERLILEITEDVMISDKDIIQEKAKKLKEAGIKLSLDDFGTGYSSLKYLTTRSFDEIKIDKSFIDNIVDSEDAFALLSSIVAIAKITGYQVVAEGVENEEQVASVLKAGCNVIQGYYFSKPGRIEEVIADLQNPSD